ncbi:MAG: lysine 2,3-aminomutase, partial [Bacteroidota bacterium]
MPETDESEEPPASLPMLKKALTPVLQYHTSNRSLEFLHQHFPQATQKDWNSWQWQLKNSFTSMATLSRVLDLKENEIRPRPGYNDILPLRITPYYASLMDPQDSTQPLRRSMVPVLDEFAVSPGEASDPLAEGHDSVVPNLVHRYPDR